MSLAAADRRAAAGPDGGLHVLRPRVSTLIGLTLLVLAALVAYRHDIFSPEPLRDERLYIAGFAAQAQSGSAYSAPPFNYPPPFTVLLTALWQAMGEPAFLRLLRLLSLLGACLGATLAVAPLRWPAAWRWAAAAALVWQAFPVRFAVDFGNVSPLILGLTIGALVLVPRRPLLGGILLGFGIAMKPMAVAAIPLLALYGWRRGSRRDPAVRAVLAAVATSGLLYAAIGRTLIPAFVRAAAVPMWMDHELSIGRILRGFGWSPPAPFALILVVSITAAIALPRCRDWLEARTLILAVSPYALPIVWAHTLMLTFPLQALALQRALDSRRRVLWTALVAAAVICLDGRNGSNVAPGGLPAPVYGLIAGVPLLALIVLCMVLLRPVEASESVA